MKWLDARSSLFQSHKRHIQDRTTSSGNRMEIHFLLNQEWTSNRLQCITLNDWNSMMTMTWRSQMKSISYERPLMSLKACSWYRSKPTSWLRRYYIWTDSRTGSQLKPYGLHYVSVAFFDQFNCSSAPSAVLFITVSLVMTMWRGIHI